MSTKSRRESQRDQSCASSESSVQKEPVSVTSVNRRIGNVGKHLRGEVGGQVNHQRQNIFWLKKIVGTWTRGHRGSGSCTQLRNSRTRVKKVRLIGTFS